MTPAGALTVFSFPGGAGHSSIGIASGPDGNLWFTDFGANQVGRVTTAGAIVEFDLPTASAFPDGITAGPDGNMWFTEFTAGEIGRIYLRSLSGSCRDSRGARGSDCQTSGQARPLPVDSCPL